MWLKIIHQRKRTTSSGCMLKAIVNKFKNRTYCFHLLACWLHKFKAYPQLLYEFVQFVHLIEGGQMNL